MAIGRNGHIKGSTLAESLIALVIISIVLSIGIMVHANVLSGDRTLREVRAMRLMEELEGEEGQRSISLERNGLKVVRKEREVAGGEGLVKVEMTVHQKGKQEKELFRQVRYLLKDEGLGK